MDNLVRGCSSAWESTSLKTMVSRVQITPTPFGAIMTEKSKFSITWKEVTAFALTIIAVSLVFNIHFDFFNPIVSTSRSGLAIVAKDSNFSVTTNDSTTIETQNNFYAPTEGEERTIEDAMNAVIAKDFGCKVTDYNFNENFGVFNYFCHLNYLTISSPLSVDSGPVRIDLPSGQKAYFENLKPSIEKIYGLYSVDDENNYRYSFITGEYLNPTSKSTNCLIIKTKFTYPDLTYILTGERDSC